MGNLDWAALSYEPGEERANVLESSSSVHFQLETTEDYSLSGLKQKFITQVSPSYCTTYKSIQNICTV